MSARLSWGVHARVGSRVPQRKKAVLNVDLNVPAIENHDEGTSSLPSRSQSVPIDVDVDDDDVLISSPRAFAEAKNKSRRNRQQRVIDVDAEGSSRGSKNNKKRYRVPAGQSVIDCETYVNLEHESHNTRANGVRHEAQGPRPPSPPPPPPAPTFSCPICMGTLVEEMSTKCGHIFCKACIKLAIAKQSKCPACRKKITMKDVIRIYLPSTS